jgi:hypothetical protein
MPSGHHARLYAARLCWRLDRAGGYIDREPGSLKGLRLARPAADWELLGGYMLTGTCLCSRVRYEIDGKIGPVAHCHCVTCRKAQGGAFCTNAPVRRKYFRLLSGADCVAEFESSPGKKRCFCRHCGSPLWSRRDADPDTIRIRLGLLNSDPERRPLAHVWLSEKAPWYEITDDLPRSDGNGEELEASLRVNAGAP